MTPWLESPLRDAGHVQQRFKNSNSSSETHLRERGVRRNMVESLVVHVAVIQNASDLLRVVKVVDGLCVCVEGGDVCVHTCMCA